MKATKPTIGMLVRPKADALHFFVDDPRDIMYSFDAGLVTDCVGIRCKVQWHAGHVTEVFRGDLEVISDGQ